MTSPSSEGRWEEGGERPAWQQPQGGGLLCWDDLAGRIAHLLGVDLVQRDAAARVRGAEAEVCQAGHQRQRRRQRRMHALGAARALRPRRTVTVRRAGQALVGPPGHRCHLLASP